jgi:hypothetical protein
MPQKKQSMPEEDQGIPEKEHVTPEEKHGMPKGGAGYVRVGKGHVREQSFVPPPSFPPPPTEEELSLFYYRVEAANTSWSTSQYIHDVLCAPCGLYGGVMTFQGRFMACQGGGRGFFSMRKGSIPKLQERVHSTEES